MNETGDSGGGRAARRWIVVVACIFIVATGIGAVVLFASMRGADDVTDGDGSIARIDVVDVEPDRADVTELEIERGPEQVEDDDASDGGAFSGDASYLLPDAATHLYSEEELAGFTDDELFYARNEIYARHGRGFTSERLRGYFEARPWYSERYTPEEFDSNAANVLNDTERQNAATILNMEKARGSSNL